MAVRKAAAKPAAAKKKRPTEKLWHILEESQNDGDMWWYYTESYTTKNAALKAAKEMVEGCTTGDQVYIVVKATTKVSYPPPHVEVTAVVEEYD